MCSSKITSPISSKKKNIKYFLWFASLLLVLIQVKIHKILIHDLYAQCCRFFNRFKYVFSSSATSNELTDS